MVLFAFKFIKLTLIHKCIERTLLILHSESSALPNLACAPLSLSCPFLSLTTPDMFLMSSIIALPLAGHMEEKIVCFLLFGPSYFLRSILYQLWCPSDERGSFSPQALQVCSDRVGSRKLSWWTELNSGPGSAADLGEWPLFPGPLWSLLCQRRPTPDFLCRRYVWDPLESNSEGKQDVVWKTRGEEEWSDMWNAFWKLRCQYLHFLKVIRFLGNYICIRMTIYER